MTSEDKATAINIQRIWYENLFSREISNINTYISSRVIGDISINRLNRNDDKTRVFIERESPTDTCKRLYCSGSNTRYTILNPTLFDTNNLTQVDYDLAINSYYSVVVEEFGLDTGEEYRYDTNMPVFLGKDINYNPMAVDILSYKAYDAANPSIEDMLSRMECSFMQPARFDTDCLIISDWPGTTAGQILRQMASHWCAIINKYNHAYKEIHFAISDLGQYNVFRDIFYASGTVV